MTPRPKKMTPAQTRLLDEIENDGHADVIDTYLPAMKLLALGLAEARSIGFARIRLTRS